MTEEPYLSWIPFSQEFARQLLAYKNNRRELLGRILTDFDNKIFLSQNTRMDASGLISAPRWVDSHELAELDIDYIDPFSVMALFNNNLRNRETIKVANKLAKILRIDLEIPNDTIFCDISTLPSSYKFVSFPNIVYSSNRRFNYEKGVNTLWELFEIAVNSIDKYPLTFETKEKFIRTFNDSLKIDGIALTKITTNLFCVNPEYFLILNKNNTEYIAAFLLPKSSYLSFNLITGTEYLDIADSIHMYIHNLYAEFSDILDMPLKILATFNTVSTFYVRIAKRVKRRKDKK